MSREQNSNKARPTLGVTKSDNKRGAYIIVIVGLFRSRGYFDIIGNKFIAELVNTQ